MDETDRPSTPSLIGDAIRQSTELVSAELQLARLELTEKMIKAVVSVAGILGATIFIIVALIFLLQGLVELLVQLAHWPPFAASFAVGGGIAVLALVAILLAARNLSGAKLKPNRTIRQVQGAADVVRSAR